MKKIRTLESEGAEMKAYW